MRSVSNSIGGKVLVEHRSGRVVLTAMKALVLVGAAWGVVYPALLWSLGRLLQ
ncbi:hypothetical protein [Roseateles violae]|uniref:Uncharacterized protein n=1 Tax=Roseateles violae TaxID=3058042 RepID=A0ABT8DJW4_9BURK|nr:hypothetical protein [Pelomonas sp. PFR6]MDN3918710.1 hypothetical protein [Pelomonas sp. PFR6]